MFPRGAGEGKAIAAPTKLLRYFKLQLAAS
jgi:hypothetical protein